MLFCMNVIARGFKECLERTDHFLRQFVSECAQACCTNHCWVFRSSGWPSLSGEGWGGPGRAPAHLQLAAVLGGTCCESACGFPVQMGVRRMKRRLWDGSPCLNSWKKGEEKDQEMHSCCVASVVSEQAGSGIGCSVTHSWREMNPVYLKISRRKSLKNTLLKQYKRFISSRSSHRIIFCFIVCW